MRIANSRQREDLKSWRTASVVLNRAPWYYDALPSPPMPLITAPEIEETKECSLLRQSSIEEIRSRQHVHQI